MLLNYLIARCAQQSSNVAKIHFPLSTHKLEHIYMSICDMSTINSENYIITSESVDISFPGNRCLVVPCRGGESR